MTELVVQRTAYDCGICSIAMALGRSYEEVVAAAGDDFSEKGLRSEVQALKGLGLNYNWRNGEPDGDFVSLHRGWAISPEFFRSLAWGRRALMSVPSLNKEGSWHMIYWTGDHVLDPSPNKTYAEWGQLLPNEMTLFRERPRP